MNAFCGGRARSLAVALSLVVACGAVGRAADTYSNQGQINQLLSFEVKGYGKQFFEVAMADVVFSITERNKGPQLAKSGHDAALAKVKQFLLAGDAKDDRFELKATRLYRDPNRESAPDDDFYVCRSEFFVRRSRVEGLAEFQAGLVERGVDEILNVTLFSARQRELEDQARTLAIEDARRKALLTAEELDWRLGKVLRIQYEDPNWRVWNNADGGFGGRNGDGHGVSPENIAGADYVESTVTLTFEYGIE